MIYEFLLTRSLSILSVPSRLRQRQPLKQQHLKGAREARLKREKKVDDVVQEWKNKQTPSNACNPIVYYSTILLL